MADPSYIDSDGVLTDGEAWVGIAHASLSLPAALVTFTSTNDGQTGDFSQYLDMVLVCYTRTDAVGNSYLKLLLNNDTSALWRTTSIHYDGSSLTTENNVDSTNSFIAKNGSVITGAATEIFCASVTDLVDINSQKYKSVMTLSATDMDTTDTDENRVQIFSGTFGKQDPISRIDVKFLYGSNFVAGCVFSLFGVLPRMVAP